MCETSRGSEGHVGKQQAHRVPRPSLQTTRNILGLSEMATGQMPQWDRHRRAWAGFSRGFVLSCCPEDGGGCDVLHVLMEILISFTPVHFSLTISPFRRAAWAFLPPEHNPRVPGGLQCASSARGPLCHLPSLLPSTTAPHCLCDPSLSQCRLALLVCEARASHVLLLQSNNGIQLGNGNQMGSKTKISASSCQLPRDEEDSQKCLSMGESETRGWLLSPRPRTLQNCL